ncbi:MAG: glutamyl-tRNA amidotransferase [Flavobacteriales bacterium]|nr:glutamyl-tRNA amidotransferase [Flavobacteriales bacterium]|tara:strand:+ start:196 stop:642 length:447 start_codon:yes stop_codon:yes gene_type:complete
MSLEKKIMLDIKDAMRSKDSVRLEVCRSVKSAILLVKTEKKSEDLSEEKEIEILQKLLKQRSESEKIYIQQSRHDLAQIEKNQADIILKYLPTPYSVEELEKLVDKLILQLNIESKKDMGRLMSEVLKQAKGRADGKAVSVIVQSKLK